LGRGSGENCGMPDLIAVAEARERVLAAVRVLPAEPVPVADALSRVLAEDVQSELDVPPFDPSAMDGFALVAGPAGELRVIGESRAGRPFEGRVEPRTAVRISTGARMPAGADAVVPVERTGRGDGVVEVPETAPGDNVRRAGEDIRAGATVLRAGAVIGPPEAGVLCSVGRSEAACALQPRVAVVVTGDELAEPGEPLGPGRIYGSNGVALAAAVARAGGTVASLRTVPDEAADTRRALESSLASADLLVVSGGVSVGAHDHVRPALIELGVEERFWGVRLKPGKPTWFGVRGPTLAFGLPGNPVSALVTFQLFVRPALRSLQGAPPEATRATAVLEEPVERSPRREQAVRCRLRAADDGWHAALTGPQGSHVLTSLVGADALALVPAGEGELAAGERVEIELLEH
jgi:molybdopterin molybdotransferase